MVLTGRILETHLNKKQIGGWMPFPYFLKSNFGCTGEGGKTKMQSPLSMTSLRQEEEARLEQEERDAANRSLNSTASEEKDDERPAGGKGLPTVNNPFARGEVNYGGGSQEAKGAKEKSASRRREQQRVREEAGKYRRPTPEQADQFHVALLTPLSQAVLEEHLESDPVPVGLYPKSYLLSQFNSEVGPGGYP